MNRSKTVSLGALLRWQLFLVTGLMSLGIVAFFFIRVFAPGVIVTSAPAFLHDLFTAKFFFYLAAGFAAQLIDGALGMAYGVTSTSLLLASGVSPAVASASVHVAEVFTTGASGISHWRFGNLRRDLFVKLALPGAVGAALGAYVLSSFDGAAIKPYVAVYLLVMGLVILLKTLGKIVSFGELKHIRPLALVGGFVDASGGGGWGPVVTSTLLGAGHRPRVTIGTINAVEFVVALTASGVFSLFVGLSGWPVILGLITG
ncbi:MAG: sulfite exporter TauE/SafE family protein, partial [Candidatus Binatia bacterium]